MKPEEKSLLLKDLCARLPYNIICHANGFNLDGRLLFINKVYNIVALYNDKITEKFDGYLIDDIKPYLRPMSSMTEEEMEELKTLCSIYIPTDSPTIGFEDYGITVLTHHLTNNTYSFKLNLDIIDWLNVHYFDYRGLIPMGLALEAPKGMYN